MQEETAQLKSALNATNTTVGNIAANTAMLADKVKVMETSCPHRPQDHPTPEIGIDLVERQLTSGAPIADGDSEDFPTVVKKKRTQKPETLTKKPDQPQPVQRRKQFSQKKVIQGTAKCTISTVKTRRIHVHVSRFAPSLDPQELADHLKAQLKCNVGCEKILHDESPFASFQVTADLENPQTLYAEEIWPEGAVIRCFIVKRGFTGSGNGGNTPTSSTSML